MSNIIMKKPKVRRTRNLALVANEAYKEIPSATLEDGRVLLKQNKYNKAYKDTQGNISIGIRGSADMSDYALDAKKLLFGDNLLNSERYKNTDTFIKDVRRENPNAKISASGHSLGGTILNRFVNENAGVINQAEAYNPFITRNQDLSADVKNYRKKGDLASVLGTYSAIAGNKKIEEFEPEKSADGVLATHSLSNFLKKGGRIYGMKRQPTF